MELNASNDTLFTSHLSKNLIKWVGREYVNNNLAVGHRKAIKKRLQHGSEEETVAFHKN